MENPRIGLDANQKNAPRERPINEKRNIEQRLAIVTYVRDLVPCGTKYIKDLFFFRDFLSRFTEFIVIYFFL